jgi:hypothetical protein
MESIRVTYFVGRSPAMAYSCVGRGELATVLTVCALTANVGQGSIFVHMITMKIWGPVFGDRRSVKREPADFYAVELVAGARYLRRICNVSAEGLLLEDRMTLKEPGSIIQLELPKRQGAPVKVSAEVVRVGRGAVGVRALNGASLDGLGGSIAL